MEKEDNEQKITRARLPRGDEIIGIIEQRLGGNKMLIRCLDGKTRNCRVPGRLKRKLWLRPNDVVIIKPWEFDKDKGDIIYKYFSSEISSPSIFNISIDADCPCPTMRIFFLE